MIYKVILSERAEQQLEHAYQWYHDRSPQAAAKWYNGFIDAQNSLSEDPQLRGFARENQLFPVEVRQLLYGRRRNYRALFTVRGDTVFVFSIRHSAQRDVSPDDI